MFSSKPIKWLALAAVVASNVNAYWLMGIENFITTERIDPVVNPGAISGHVHSVLGGSNFRFSTSTAQLRQSQCTSIPIPQDKSNYWFPHLYFQWNNGSFTSLNGGAVIDTPGTTTAFPDDFRMLSGDPLLRTYDGSNPAQQAVTYLCLNFKGQSKRSNNLPSGTCPDGIRAQINFQSCWDGKNTDSHDHQSHVSWPSGGADSGTCNDPNFPITLPRIFLEVYWDSVSFDSVRNQAMNPDQPFVFSHGDPTGYGYHADFINGWDSGVLQRAVDGCNCDPFGDPHCCVNKGLFDLTDGKTCRITPAIDEQTTGTLSKLPGNNPVQPAGTRATMMMDTHSPALINPVYAYTGNSPTQTGTVVPGSGGGQQTDTIPTPQFSSSSTSSTQVTPTTTTRTHVVPTTTTTPTTTPVATTTRTTVSTPVFPSFSFPSFSFPSFGQPTYHAYGNAPAATRAVEVNHGSGSSSSSAPTSSPTPYSSPYSSSSGSTSGSTSGSGSGSAPRCNNRHTQSRRRQTALEKHRRRVGGGGSIGVGGGVNGGWYQHPHVRHVDY